MNQDIIAGNWMQLKGKIKAQWGELTDDQIEQIGGKRDMLAGKIQELYGVSRDEVEMQLRDFEERNTDYRQRRAGAGR